MLHLLMIAALSASPTMAIASPAVKVEVAATSPPESRLFGLTKKEVTEWSWTLGGAAFLITSMVMVPIYLFRK